jgi:TetR/AcrR family transcriptional regulator, tetracycline repressor protein
MSRQRTRVRRNTLDRAAIAVAALDLMDTKGVAALTIRSLAAKLGVAPMALYNYVSTKEDILDAARDQALTSLLSTMDAGADNWPWWERIRQINVALQRALRKHPSLVTLLVARPLAGRVPIGAAEAQLHILLDAGFTPHEAARIHLTLLHYAIGTAAWTVPRGPEQPAAGRAALARLPADRYPILSALAEPLATATYDADQYEHGLDLLLSALRARVDGRNVGQSVSM